MTEAKRIWWEALADQYEEWADDGGTDYTCTLLDEGDWGWLMSHDDPEDGLTDVWLHHCGETPFPAGLDDDDGRVERRADFCHWMAETIREYLDTGRGPWETE